MRVKNILAILATLLVTTIASAAPRTITLATAEGRTAGSAAKDLAGLLAHLNASPDLKFVLKTYPGYDATYEGFKKGEAELMLIGAVKYVQAHFEIGAIPVVVEEPRWQESVIIVAKGSPIKTIPELKGKKFAFGYEDSATTHLLPLLLLSKYQMTGTDMKSSFLGNDQVKIIDAVATGQVDGGSVATIVYEAHKDQVRELEKSERIPSGTIVAHKEIDEKLLSLLRARFVAYKPTGEATHLRFAQGAVVATDADYNKVRFLCKVLFKKSYL